MIACPGAWKNFEEMEESLSLPELHQILSSWRDVELRRFKQQAALKGIDLDKGSDADAEFQRVKRQAEAKLRGISEEQLEFESIGIAVEEVD